MYRAIERFRDLTDGHLYNPGEAFPFDGREVPAERLETLATARNRSNKPLIAPDNESPVSEPEQAKKPARGRRKTT